MEMNNVMISDCYYDPNVWCPPDNWTGTEPDVFLSFESSNLPNTTDGPVRFSHIYQLCA